MKFEYSPSSYWTSPSGRTAAGLSARIMSDVCICWHLPPLLRRPQAMSPAVAICGSGPRIGVGVGVGEGVGVSDGLGVDHVVGSTPAGAGTPTQKTSSNAISY